MTDEEILKKYAVEIKRDVNEIVKEYKLTDSARIKLVAKKYEESFVIGFREGAVKVKVTIEIAKNLLKAGLANDLIAKSTGLSIEEVAKLKD